MKITDKTWGQGGGQERARHASLQKKWRMLEAECFFDVSKCLNISALSDQMETSLLSFYIF